MRTQGEDGVLYRIRLELDGADPPLWRRTEVSPELFLDQFHEVLQSVVGWTDSHLHRFSSTPGHTEGAEYFLCPFDVAEYDEGTPEERVRLDDVLRTVGDRLYYQYDYGDDWRHTLELEAVVPADAGASPARCLDGARPGPPEDCGGIEGYERMVAISDPAHPEHDAAVREFADLYGYLPDPTNVEVVHLDVDAVNRELTALDLAPRPRIGHVPATLEELLRAVLDPQVRPRLVRLVAEARLNRPVEVEGDTAERMVRPYRWLLDRVGDGISLTTAGYLPPVHVEAAFTELGLEEEWIGAGNREVDTLPVLRLRESAQELGLLRKARGRLTVTKRGQRLRDDPVALWHHLAERLPVGTRDEAARQAGIVLLLAVAAGMPEDPRPLVTEVLAARGWRHQDGTPLDSTTVSFLLGDNLEVLHRLGVLAGDRWERWPGSPTPDGMVLARGALAD